MTDLARLHRLRDQLAVEHAKAVRADQQPRPDLDHLRVTAHNGIAAGLETALFFVDHHLREAGEGARTTPDNPATSGDAADNPARTALAEVLAYLHALTRVGGSVIGYQTVNDIPEASYDRWRAVRDAGEEDAGERTWSPPPPGDRREQLPDDVLRLLVPGTYTCDPCQTARSLHAVALGRPEQAAALDLDGHRERLHARCQIVQPWTGLECRCRCPKAE